MSAVAVGVDLDQHWRLLQGKDKPKTRRGWRLMHCNPRRARGDRCPHRERHTEGPRVIALERARRDEIEQGAEDDRVDYDFDPLLVRPSFDDVGEYLEERSEVDLGELDPPAREAAIMFAIDTRRRRARERVPDIHARINFLREHLAFFDQFGSSNPVSMRALDKLRLELYELETLLYAA